jgi:hypothetical protein
MLDFGDSDPGTSPKEKRLHPWDGMKPRVLQ